MDFFVLDWGFSDEMLFEPFGNLTNWYGNHLMFICSFTHLQAFLLYFTGFTGLKLAFEANHVFPIDRY